MSKFKVKYKKKMPLEVEKKVDASAVNAKIDITSG